MLVQANGEKDSEDEKGEVVHFCECRCPVRHGACRWSRGRALAH